MSASPAPEKPADELAVAAIPSGGWRELWSIEDWWAVWLGGAILVAGLLFAWNARPPDLEDRIAALEARKQELSESGGPLVELTKKQDELTGTFKAPFKSWIARLQKWEANPLDAVYSDGKHNALGPLGMVLLASLVLFGVGVRVMGESYARFASALVPIFGLACLAYILAAQSLVKWANLEYPLWALLVGLSISNILGTPEFLKPAVKTEFYIKTGLVLLGA